MTWAPIQPRHAIERVRVSLIFANPLPAKWVNNLGALFESHREKIAFGAREEKHSEGIQVAVGPTGPQFQPVQSLGWRFLRTNDAEQAIEAVELNQNEFSYETSEYTSWSDCKERILDVTEKLVQRIVNDTDISLVSLEYFDRFYSVGGQPFPDPSVIIDDEILSSLDNSIRSGVEPWHLHRGWFTSASGHQVLVNQNLDAQDGTLADSKISRSIAILTRADRRNSSGQPVGDFDFFDLMDRLHGVTDSVFKSAITDEAKRMIGMIK